MNINYYPFTPNRKLAEYVGQAGHEANGQRLTAAAYDSLAASKVSGLPADLVVIGEYRREDGAAFLAFGCPREHIEAVTDYRWDEDAHRLRLLCPICGAKDGRHEKSCSR